MGQIDRNENMYMVLLTFGGVFGLWSSIGSRDPFSIPCFLGDGGPEPLFPVSQSSQYPGPNLRGSQSSAPHHRTVSIPSSLSHGHLSALFPVSQGPQCSAAGPRAPDQEPQHLSIVRVMDAVVASSGASGCQCWQVLWAVCKIPVNWFEFFLCTSVTLEVNVLADWPGYEQVRHS